MQGNMKMSQLSYPTNMNSYSIHQNWIFFTKKVKLQDFNKNSCKKHGILDKIHMIGHNNKK